MKNQKSFPEPHEFITSGANISVWTDTVKPIEFKKPVHDMETDVVIVGGGIAGITTAYCLSKSGLKVMVVEDGFIGSGETGRTTAHLVTALDDRYYELEEKFGTENMKLIAGSHQQAIDFIEQVIKKENIDCDFIRLSGYLFRDPGDDEDALNMELASAKNAGLDVEMMNEVPGLDKKQPGICFKNQAQFHPCKYLKGLCNAIIENGGEIFTETHAEKIDHDGIVTAHGLQINAKYIVVATNSPVNNKFLPHLEQTAYRTYVIAATIEKGKLPDALWWDTGDRNVNEEIPPYHYIRLQKYSDTHDLLLAGGEDHPTGTETKSIQDEEKIYSKLESWTRANFNIEEIIYRWSGQVVEPSDSLAYIGKNPMDKKNIFIATGDSGNGMTYGTIAGMLINDLIHEKDNPLEAIYDPGRINMITSGKALFKGFIEHLKEKKKEKKEHFDKTFMQIEKGSAQVIKLFDKKYGVFRSESGEFHLIDPTCTHLGCSLNWNTDEKSWDCPCHGSRFTPDGKVMNGPANFDLIHYKLKHLPGEEIIIRQ